MKTKMPVMLVMMGLLAVPVWADSPVAGIVAKYPATTLVDDINNANALIKLGPDGMREIAKLIIPLGSGNDTNARFALAGITRHVMREGGEADRKAYVAVLIAALAANKDVEVKTFFLHEIQQCGRGDAVDAIAPLLADAALCDPAAMALQRISTESSSKALLTALPTSTGAQRITLVKSCGAANVTEAAEEILKSATSPDATLRLTALQALGELGAPPAAADVLKKATEVASLVERSRATSDYLAFARRVGKTNAAKGAEICRDVIKTRIAPDEANVRSAALSSLVSIIGDAALPELLSAANTSEIEQRMAALNVAQSLPGQPVTERFVQLMTESSVAEIRMDVLGMLVRRADKSATAAVIDLLGDDDNKVTLAAITGAGKLGGDAAIPALIEFMCAGDAEQIKAAADALSRLPGKNAMSAVAASLHKGKTSAATVAMLELVGLRPGFGAEIFSFTSDPAAEVRMAAIKALATVGSEQEATGLLGLAINSADSKVREAALVSAVSIAQIDPDEAQRANGILVVMKNVKGADRAPFLVALSRLGGSAALDAVKTEVASPNPAVKEAAVRALADWPDSAALDSLLKVAASESDTTLQVIAIRGVIHLISLSTQPVSERAAAYQSAMAAAKRPEEKRLLLAAMAGDGWSEMLPIIAGAMDDSTVKLDAARAVVKLVVPRGKRTAGLHGAAAKESLEKAAAIVTDPSEREDAQKYLKTMKGK